MNPQPRYRPDANPKPQTPYPIPHTPNPKPQTPNRNAGGVKVLIKIVVSGKNKDMVRYALGALRNLANDLPIQRQLVDEGLLEACIFIRCVLSRISNVSQVYLDLYLIESKQMIYKTWESRHFHVLYIRCLSHALYIRCLLSVKSCALTRNPKPETLNSKPETLNPARTIARGTCSTTLQLPQNTRRPSFATSAATTRSGLNPKP